MRVLRIHHFIPLIFILLAIHFPRPTFGMDRATQIQSKIHSSLSQILPSTDFLVLVHRLEEDSQNLSPDNFGSSLKPLPGLPLAVSSKGELISTTYSSTDYTGPVKITVLLDPLVDDETFQTFQSLMPEIVGGLQDSDEIRIQRSKLRQTNLPSNLTPPIQINNYPNPSDMDKNKSLTNNSSSVFTFNDWIKFIALLFISMGILVFLISKLLSKSNDNSVSRVPLKLKNSEKTFDRNNTFADRFFAALPPKIVSIYLMKSITNQRWDRLKTWYEFAPLDHQRKVFQSFPPWVAAYFQELIDRNQVLSSSKKNSVEVLLREIALLENNLKQETNDELAFLRWFPSAALRFVPEYYRQNLSESSREVLWVIRPELGQMVHTENALRLIPTELKNITQCYNELMAWPSTWVVLDSRPSLETLDILWARKINQLQDFGSIESQIEQAKKELDDLHFQSLLKSIVCLETPLNLKEAERKLWMRNVDPQDFYWWLHIVKTKPTWDFLNDLRPMKRAMFIYAQDHLNHPKWTEHEKKAASLRILLGLRRQLFPEIFQFGGSGYDQAV